MNTQNQMEKGEKKKKKGWLAFMVLSITGVFRENITSQDTGEETGRGESGVAEEVGEVAEVERPPAGPATTPHQIYFFLQKGPPHPQSHTFLS